MTRRAGSPTSPKPQKGGNCGVVGQIILVVIAVVVTIYTAGAAAAAMSGAINGVAAGVSAVMGGTLASTAGASVAVAAGAIGGAVGSIVSQGVGVATGIQDKFSWNAVALAAIGGGVGAGVGASPLGKIGGAGGAALRGIVSSALTQGIGVATGLQDKFSWAGVAAAGVGAAIGEMVMPGAKLQGIGESAGRLSGAYIGASLTRSMASTIANAATRSLIEGSDFGDNLMASLPDVIGQTIGESIAGGIARSNEPIIAEGDAAEPEAAAGPALHGKAQPLKVGKQQQAQSGPALPIVHGVTKGDTVVGLAHHYNPGDPMAMVTAMIYENDLRFDADGNPIIVKGTNIVIPDLSGLDPGTVGYYRQVGTDVVAGQAQYVIDLMQIERDYQVQSDQPVVWPDIGMFVTDRTITATEARMLGDLRLAQASAGGDIVDQSFDDADAAYSPHWRHIAPLTQAPPAYAALAIDNATANPVDRLDARQGWPQNDGHNDAMRHALWSARLAQRFGQEWALQYTTAHEGINIGSSTREAMDLYNNGVGLQIAAANPGASRQEMAGLVEQSVRNGRLVVLGSDGHLRWSNQVAYGHHGYTIDLNVQRLMPTPAGNARASRH